MLKAYIPDFDLTVDVAVSQAEITQGLSGRIIGEREGMLFILQEPTSFWMKDMLIPIDIIFMDRNQVVVGLVHNAQPCPQAGECPGYIPNQEFSYVLEIVAGLADVSSIGVGTQISFQFIGV